MQDVSVRYNGAWAVQGVSLTLNHGASLALVGPNGAGKSSLLKAISRLVRSSGQFTFRGAELPADPVNVVRLGVIHCPERRRLFPDMTVSDNLELGAFALSDRKKVAEEREWVLEVIPVLSARSRQIAGTLSGGEQQMLAIARALMSAPQVLLLDEPSQGLAQIVKDDIVEIIRQIQSRGVAVMTVEQDAGFAIELSDHVVIMEGGEKKFEGSWDQLRDNRTLSESYFGIS